MTGKKLLAVNLPMAIISILRNTDFNFKEKQIKIEDLLHKEYQYNLINKLKSPHSFAHGEGLAIILEMVQNINEYLIKVKADKILLKGKPYIFYIKNTDNEVLISTVITQVIPQLLKVENLKDQSVTSMCVKIGKSLVKFFHRNSYFEYCEYFKDRQNKGEENKRTEYNFYSKENNKVIKIEKGVTFEDFIKRIIPKILDEEEDFVKYGLDLLNVVAEKSDLFSISELYEEKHSYRVLLMDTNAKNNILQMLSFDYSTFPMIYKPNP